MNKNEMPAALFDLILDKSFEELSDSERDMVVSIMTADEYEAHHYALHSFKSIDKDFNFNGPGLPKVDNKKSYLYKLIHYRIPFYQVAAGIALLVMGMFALSTSSSNQFINNAGPSIDAIPGISVADSNYPDSLIFNL